MPGSLGTQQSLLRKRGAGCTSCLMDELMSCSRALCSFPSFLSRVLSFFCGFQKPPRACARHHASDRREERASSGETPPRPPPPCCLLPSAPVHHSSLQLRYDWPWQGVSGVSFV